MILTYQVETVEANAQQQLEDIVAPGEIFFPTCDLGENILYNIVFIIPDLNFLWEAGDKGREWLRRLVREEAEAAASGTGGKQVG